MARRTVDIVLKDCWLVDCRKVAAGRRSANDALESLDPAQGMVGDAPGCTYPLVKTLSREVFPEAPSPLRNKHLSVDGPSFFGPCRFHRIQPTYSKTSLRWTVLLPPIPQGMLVAMSVAKCRRRCLVCPLRWENWWIRGRKEVDGIVLRTGADSIVAWVVRSRRFRYCRCKLTLEGRMTDGLAGPAS